MYNAVRFCAGSHFAEATLWITAAQILATFDISAIVDGNGRKVIPPINGSSGLLSCVFLKNKI